MKSRSSVLLPEFTADVVVQKKIEMVTSSTKKLPKSGQFESIVVVGGGEEAVFRQFVILFNNIKNVFTLRLEMHREKM